MLQFFLIYALLFALFTGIIKLIDLPTINRIKNSKDLNTALDYRNKLARNRKIAFFAFVGMIVLSIGAITLYWIIQNVGNTDSIILCIIYTFILIVILYIFLKTSNQYHNVQGNISTMSVEDFLAVNDRFVLYLRGFESDVYNQADANIWDFSEDWLSQVISNGIGIPMCAVGMTKEADSPIGGMRVYVDDSDWKEKVLELMEKAEMIIIRINDRSSCLWEIGQSKPFDEKCIFVADNIVQYNNAKNALINEINLPAIPNNISLESDKRSYYFISDKQIKHFKGTIADYCEMIGLQRDAVKVDQIKDRTVKPFYKKPFYVFLIVLSFLALIRGIAGGIIELISNH